MLGWLILAAAVQSTLASCECGYKTNTGEVWQYQIITNFSSGSLSYNDFNATWQTIDKIQGDVTDSTPYQINYTTANVILSTGTASSDNLQLVASAYTGQPGGAVASGEIATVRDDILFGSFRARYAVTGGSGAVAGFFSYADDTNENDVEVRTKDGNDQVLFTNQGTDTTNSSVAKTLPNGALTTATQTYRFDWTQDAVKYFVNDYFMTNITENASQEASRIFLNAWSNGNDFTGGPPVVDMQMTVESIVLYFNSSDTSTVAEFTSACKAATSGQSTCSVDSSTVIYSSDQTSAAAAVQTGALTSTSRALLAASAALILAFQIW